MPDLEFKYELSYRPLISETNGGNTLTQPFPVIEVALTYNGITVSDLALIDSGSTYSLFSRDVADQLGIEVLDGDKRKLTTLGGPLIAYSHKVEIEVVPNLRYEAEILFSEYPIPRNLFGHTGFLEQVAIALRSKFGLIYINPET